MKWITLVSFIIALASMPATAQPPHQLKGATLSKHLISSDVRKFDYDKSGIDIEWVNQQILLALKANKLPLSSGLGDYMLTTHVRIIEVKLNSGDVISYAWTVETMYLGVADVSDNFDWSSVWNNKGGVTIGINPDKASLKTTLRDQIRDQVDEFCAAYYAAN
jgi:hypothetical protein